MHAKKMLARESLADDNVVVFVDRSHVKRRLATGRDKHGQFLLEPASFDDVGQHRVISLSAN